MDKERIPKLVIPVGKFDENGYGIKLSDTIFCCHDCGSFLHYIKKVLGIVVEKPEKGVYGWREGNRYYAVRTIGYLFYCAECGRFMDDNYVNLYHGEDVLHRLELEDMDDYVELQRMIHHYNEKGVFKETFTIPELSMIKEEIEKYEKKHPILKNQKKSKNGKEVSIKWKKKQQKE